MNHLKLNSELVMLGFFQVEMLLHGYCQGLLSRDGVQEMLSIGKTRFFAILKEYPQDPEPFSIAYERHTLGQPLLAPHHETLSCQFRKLARNWAESDLSLTAGTSS